MSTVTIIIPNYNHAKYLNQRIESVLAQTYENTEIILLDDCSTDDSRILIEKYRKNNRVTKIIYNETNSGSPFIQWNKGVRLALGKYVWIAESDDYADSNFLKTLVEKLEADPTLGLAYCQSWKVDAEDNLLGTWHEHTQGLDALLWTDDFVSEGKEMVKKFMIRRNVIPNASAVVFRRFLYEKVGGADESNKVNSDWILWVNMLLQSNVAFTAVPLNYFRNHDNNARDSIVNDAKYLEEESKVFAYIANQIQTDHKAYELALSKLMDKWIDATLERKVSSNLHKKVYETLHQVESRLNLKIIRKVVKRLLSR